MPTKTFTADTAMQVVALIPAHQVGRVTGMIVDNQGNTAEVRFTLRRVLDPDASNAVTSPARNRTEDVTYLAVGARLATLLDSDSLQDIRGIGALFAVADGIWAQCRCAVSFHLE